MWNKALILALGLCVATPAFAELEKASNPNPAEDDVKVPMPGGFTMVFHIVRVPGKRFWGDEQREALFGDAEGASTFESPQKIEIGGSFEAASGEEWTIYLGKYEVTKAQYAAVMGGGDLVKGLTMFGERSSDPSDKGLATLAGDGREKELARPVSGLRYADYFEFIDTYNRWCFQTPECLAVMPRLRDAPGFFRLPTEIEWEYAARGGKDALLASGTSFTAKLPFAANDLAEHAWAGDRATQGGANTTRIGRFQPTSGVYDLFGNVQEIMSGVFYARIGQGKPGALVVRGGSYIDSYSRFRSSMRSEIGIYQWNKDKASMEEVRSLTTGIRLAIGSYTIVSSEYRQTIEDEYKDYLTRISSSSALTAPPAGSSASSVVKATEPLGRIRQISDEVAKANPALASQLAEISAQTTEAQKLLDLRAQEASSNAASMAIFSSMYYADIYSRTSRLRAQLEKSREAAKLETRLQEVVARMEADLVRDDEDLNAGFGVYVNNVAELASYGRDYATGGLGRVPVKPEDRLGQTAVAMLQKHLEDALSGKRPTDDWRAAMNTAYSDPTIMGR